MLILGPFVRRFPLGRRRELGPVAPPDSSVEQALA